MARFKQGYFTPKHPEKYVGDITKIRYMSSYELYMHEFLDNNENVIQWSSEEIVIPYVKPTDGRIHRYFPDYWVKFLNKRGEIVEEIIEIKPYSQTRAPRRTHKHYLYEQVTAEINKAKWMAAQAWCAKNNMTFRIVTEKGLYK